jgi:glycosyltransferase involved in cell wall biosynthesis
MMAKPWGMRIAIIGDRGIPARYSGFSTLVEELALRLSRDHLMDVTVYCRNHYYSERSNTYRGVHRVFLPAPGGNSFESIVHSNLSILHAATRGYDLGFVVDPGNAPFVVPLMLRRIPIVMHTDGLGWQRTKWSPLQQRYYKWAEKVCTRLADWLVTDSRIMQRYYLDEYGALSSFIPYSGEVGEPPSDEGLSTYGLERRGYYLVVARLVPENNVDLIIREYRAARLTRPLVVVGGATHRTLYVERIMAENDNNVRCVGGIFDSAVLNGLYANCYAYLHGHEVGGTNPSLLRAMQAGAPCLPIDVEFHHEVIGPAILPFRKAPGQLAGLLARVDRDPRRLIELGRCMLERARRLYRWDAVAAAYAVVFRSVREARQTHRPVADLLGSDIYMTVSASQSPAR